MKHHIILTISFFLIYSKLFSQEKEYIIDRNLKECLKGKSSNSDMINCTQIAEENWDQELNKYYQQLMKELSLETKEKLKTSQRQWIAYRDTEFDLVYTYYHYQKEGTMWHLVAASERMNFVKARAIKLKEYHEMLEY